MLGVLEQDGSFNGTLWVDDLLLVEESLGHTGGLRFSGFLPPITLFRSATLTLNPVPVPGQLPCTLSIYARGGQTQPAFSTAVPPPRVINLDPLDDFLIAEYVFTTTGSQLIVVPLDVPGLNAARNMGNRPDTLWDGWFAFHMHTRTADGTDLFINNGTAALDIDLTTRVFSGIENHLPLKQMKASRPDLCPICGDETFRETWVYCNFHERLECPRCADPGLGEEPNRANSRFELAGED